MIPVSEPLLGEREREYVDEAIRTGWISSAGKYVTEFQEKFAKYHGMKHCVAVSNGTAALEISLYALGIKPGDEVIIPSFTIMSLPLAILRLRAVPRVVDVDPDCWNITADGIARVITDKSKAIIVVHGFGHPADMDPILELAKQYDLKVVEDTAESIASRYKGRLCGTMGDVGSFSFYANKLITTGEGGCILTDSDEYAERARRYINLYFGYEERFSHEGIGYNFRMTNMQAAVGVAQLEKIDEFAAKKREIATWYIEELESCETVDFQKSIGDIDLVYWMYCMVLKDHIKMNAMDAMNFLREKGIGTRNLFKGLHAQNPLQNYLLPEDKQAEFPITEYLYERGFYVPSSYLLTRDEVRTVVDALKQLK